MKNLREIADHYHLTAADREMAREIVGSTFVPPDLIIAPDQRPYLYRWHVIPQNPHANVYFHIQVRDDPERPLHDHPWDNQSVILAGGYDEITCLSPSCRAPELVRTARAGDTITRNAEEAHRLLMPEGVAYTMTLFSTGPKRRRWGFWYPEGWVDAEDVCRQDGNFSFHTKKD